MFKTMAVTGMAVLMTVAATVSLVVSSFEEIDQSYAESNGRTSITTEATTVPVTETTTVPVTETTTVTTTVTSTTTAATTTAIPEKTDIKNTVKHRDESVALMKINYSISETELTELSCMDETDTEYCVETPIYGEYDESEYEGDSWSNEYQEPEYGSDAYLLAYAMAREAADFEDALYVGNVILNRVADEDFPDTILDVLQAPGQYPWGDAYFSRDRIYDVEFFNIAERLLAGERPLPETVVYQAQFVQGSGTYLQYGVHYYCYK